MHTSFRSFLVATDADSDRFGRIDDHVRMTETRWASADRDGLLFVALMNLLPAMVLWALILALAGILPLP